MGNYIGNVPASGEFKRLDSIASSFDGSTTQFNLSYNTTSQSVGDASQLIVSLNGIVQEPLESYTLGIGGSSIIFSTAPSSGDACHIVLLGGVGGTATPTDDSVSTVKIQDGAVTTDKVADAAITANKLAPGAAVPDQTGHAGQFLTTDGTTADWSTITQYTPPTDEGALNFLAGDGVYKAIDLSSKQDTLVSGTNIKTVNGGSVLGSGNLVVGAQEDVFYENSQTLSNSYTITSGKSAMSAGPVTLDTGVTVTIPSGSRWVIV